MKCLGRKLIGNCGEIVFGGRRFDKSHDFNNRKIIFLSQHDETFSLS